MESSQSREEAVKRHKEGLPSFYSHDARSTKVSELTHESVKTADLKRPPNNSLRGNNHDQRYIKNVLIKILFSRVYFVFFRQTFVHPEVI